MSQSQKATFRIHALAATTPIRDAIALHWKEYLMEGIELGLFMLSACIFGTLLYYAKSPVVLQLPSPAVRVVLMGLVMGATASAIIRSPMGRLSGAHFNPAVSLTFLCLGKMHWLDTVFYIICQFIGGALGVLIARIVIGASLGAPSVRYIVTVPGIYGTPGAFLAEAFMGLLMMTVVLNSANSPRFSRISWLLVGALVTTYVIAFSAISGFSMNPARTVASALLANIWTALWVYFSAPLLGMLTGAALYVWRSGTEGVYCAKLFHDLHTPCPFHCRFKQMAHVQPQASNA